MVCLIFESQMDPQISLFQCFDIASDVWMFAWLNMCMRNTSCVDGSLVIFLFFTFDKEQQKPARRQHWRLGPCASGNKFTSFLSSEESGKSRIFSLRPMVCDPCCWPWIFNHFDCPMNGLMSWSLYARHHLLTSDEFHIIGYLWCRELQRMLQSHVHLQMRVQFLANTCSSSMMWSLVSMVNIVRLIKGNHWWLTTLELCLSHISQQYSPWSKTST